MRFKLGQTYNRAGAFLSLVGLSALTLLSCTNAIPEFDQLDGASVAQPLFANSNHKIEINLTDSDLSSEMALSGTCDVKIKKLFLNVEGLSENMSEGELTNHNGLGQDGSCSDSNFQFKFKPDTDFGFSVGVAKSILVGVVGDTDLGKTPWSWAKVNYVPAAVVLPPTQLHIDGPAVVGTSTCSKFTVYLHDTNGVEVSTSAPITVDFSAVATVVSPEIHSDNGCASVQEVSNTIAAGLSSLDVYLLVGASADTFTLSAADNAGALLSSDFVFTSTSVLATIATGQPTDPDTLTALNVTVGGAGVVAYKYKLGSGLNCTDQTGYSGETPIATPISDGSLAEASLELCIVGKNGAATWQPYTAATQVSWFNDLTDPEPIIEQKTGSLDPTSALSVEFDVDFGEAIDPASFTAGDITQAGSVSISAWTISSLAGIPINSKFRIVASFAAPPAPNGTIIPTISAAMVNDLAGNSNNGSTSPVDGQVTVWQLPNVPTAPFIGARTHTTIEVNWNNGGGGTLDYRIAATPNSNGAPDINCSSGVLGTVTAGEGVIDEATRSHIITGLTPDTYYTIRICAINGTGDVSTGPTIGAQTKSPFTWVGATNSDWHNDTNWLGGLAPSSLSEAAVFDGDAVSTTSIVTLALSVKEIILDGSFIGTVQISSANPLTVAEYIKVNGGTFAGVSATANWEIGKKIHIDGGVFNANGAHITIKGPSTTGGDLFYLGLSSNGSAFVPGTSKVILDPDSTSTGLVYQVTTDQDLIFNDFEVRGETSSPAIFKSNTTGSFIINTQNQFYHRGGKIDGNWKVAGDLRVGEHAIGGPGFILMIGAGSEVYQVDTPVGKTANLVISKPGGTMLPAAGTTDLYVESLNFASADFTAPSGTLKISPSLAPDQVSLKGLINSGGSFNNNGGTVLFEIATSVSTSADINAAVLNPGASLSLKNLEIDILDTDSVGGFESSALELNGLVSVNGTFIMSDGKLNGTGLLNLYNNAIFECASPGSICSEGGSGRIKFVGGAPQTLTQQPSAALPGGVVQIFKSSNSLSLLGNIDFSTFLTQNLTLLPGTSVGTLDLNGFIINNVGHLTGDSPTTVDLNGGSINCVTASPSMGGSCPFPPPVNVATCSSYATDGEVQFFNNGMVMCQRASSIIHTSAGSMCDAGSHVCSLAEYSSNRGSVVPVGEAWMSQVGLGSPNFSTNNGGGWTNRSIGSFAPLTVIGPATSLCAELPGGGGAIADHCKQENRSSVFKNHTLCCPD